MGWSGSRRKRVRAGACAGRGARDAAGRTGPWSESFWTWHGHDGVCLTTVRRADGVAKREESAVKRPGEPLLRRWSGSLPLPPSANLNLQMGREMEVFNTQHFKQILLRKTQRRNHVSV